MSLMLEDMIVMMIEVINDEIDRGLIIETVRASMPSHLLIWSSSKQAWCHARYIPRGEKLTPQVNHLLIPVYFVGNYFTYNKGAEGIIEAALATNLVKNINAIGKKFNAAEIVAHNLKCKEIVSRH